MSRYLQKISLHPYSDTIIWTGWELEGCSGPIEGLLLADDLTEEQLAEYGVTEFQKIPGSYVNPADFPFLGE